MNTIRNFMLQLRLVLALILIVVASFACWGDPELDLTVENQTTHSLTITINDRQTGNVDPGKQIVAKYIPYTLTEFRIVAINSQREVIFSKELTREQMQKMKGRNYKVVIKP